MYAFNDDFGLPVKLTFSPEEYRNHQAGHVLIFAFYQGKLLFTRHRKRGVELPGGKVEVGESSLAAAVREVYEETGAILEGIERIGQYTIDDSMRKDIYIAKVAHYTNQPSGRDVLATIVFADIPRDVKGNQEFSRILQDDVYPLTLDRALRHPFAES
ncbi:NUDIX domain-containing protein [Brevibacillus sp. HB1.4B]|uniref:NUDIX domain-containing protein n=1 Tax=Brevibacillus TaxID=55080 RepID=UPI00156AF260|nr:NUDIX domain-containing protein [Brevibacillus sp. HB1.4B]NRS16081.1 NUDIX domain-containing protein [Brevibacillus sp. HB1.4B]